MPAVVELHIWGVPRHQVPTALIRMGLDRTALRDLHGVRFAKMLGTAFGAGFGVRHADARHWGALTTWDTAEAADRFAASRPARAWAAIADETLRVRLHPLASRGTWSGRTPFGDPTPARPVAGTTVAALTRARIKPRLWREFWRSVPPVAHDLGARDGLRLALGIGEAPVGLQGTFSVWSNLDALRDFAHRGDAHTRAVRATTELGWYSEELFARFAVESIQGRYLGRSWPEPGAPAS